MAAPISGGRPRHGGTAGPIPQSGPAEAASTEEDADPAARAPAGLPSPAAQQTEEATVPDSPGVRVEQHGPVTVVTIDRPERRNAVDGPAAAALADAFRAFDREPGAAVAVLTGAGGAFCAGADLKAIAAGEPLRVAADGDGPMGVTRLRLSKPVLAAIEGPAVGGGLELALWCDLRVAAEGATMGVFNRRFGVPLIDMGTVRLPRIVGHGRALDLILTGRAVGAAEALAMGLVNRVVPDGQALAATLALAGELAALPQAGLRNDRQSAIEQWGLPEDEAAANELRWGMATLRSGDAAAGAAGFMEGRGRHGGAFPPDPGAETRQ
jgi:enoyl-CoA hydratase/carnithine racemase